MVLHGIYHKGKITIEEKNLPDITAKVEISFPDNPIEKRDNQLGLYHLGGIYDDVNIRDTAYDER